MKQIQCAIFRGGTSKGLVLDESLLPPPGSERDNILLSLIGGGDPKQIDGLGGGVTVTSKVAMIRPSVRPGIDVDYTFAQVVVGKWQVDYRANCGNMSSAVGPFAIEQGWVAPCPNQTTVNIYNTNTNKVIVATVPTNEQGVIYEGAYKIAGVPGSGGKISLEFRSPQGASTGKLLPTGNAADRLCIPELGEVRVSIVDAANLFVFVPAEEVGLKGCESPQQLQNNHPKLIDRIELIRGMAAQLLGYTADYHDAKKTSIAVPKIIVAGPSCEYTTTEGDLIPANEMDIQARMISAMKPHPTMAMTGAMCLAAASVVPGTVVNQMMPFVGEQIDRFIRLAHPGGVMDVGVIGHIKPEAPFRDEVEIISTIGYRTARFLMRGTAFYAEGFGG